LVIRENTVSYQQPDNRRGHHRPENRRHPAGAITADNRHHGGHTGKRHALHQRQLTAKKRQTQGL